MPLNADAELSDIWTLRILLVRGSSISKLVFDRISQLLIEKFNSISLAAVEKTILNSQYIKDGSIPELSISSVTSAFQKHPLSSSTLQFSFSFDQRNTIATDEWRSLQTSRQVVAAICIDSLDHLYHVAAGSPTDTPEGSGEVVATTSRKVSYEETICGTTRDLKDKMGDLCPFLKVFQVIYVKSEEPKCAPNMLSKSSSTLESTMVSPEAWVVSLDDGDDGYWLIGPLHHFTCRLVFSFLAAIKRVSACSSSLERDTDKVSHAAAAQGPRSVLGKAKKRLGDLYLLLGLPLVALGHYHESTELFRSSGDFLWQAVSIECEASALRSYDLKHLELDIANRIAGSNKRSSGGGTFRPGTQPTLSDVPLPPEIEQLSKDAPKRWTFGLLGTPTQDTGAGHAGADSSPNKIGQVKWPGVIRQGDMASGVQYNRSIPNRAVLIEMIINRLREAIQLYQTAISNTTPGTSISGSTLSVSCSSAILLAECSIRYARFLSFLGDRLACIDCLNRLPEEETVIKTLSPSDFQSVLIACSAISEAIGSYRHFAFYLVRAALIQLNSNSNNSDSASTNLASNVVSTNAAGNVAAAKSAQRLLLLASPWYSLAPLRLIEWDRTKSAYNSMQQSMIVKSVNISPTGFDRAVSVLRNIALDVINLGSLTPTEWNLNVPDAFHVSEFPLDVHRSTYRQSSSDFLRQHASKIMLTSKAIRSQRTRHVLWPALQTMILENLRVASDRCSNLECSVFLCLAMLVLLHPAMDSRMQETVLQRINSRASKLTRPPSTPAALTILPDTTAAVIRPRFRRQSVGSRRISTLSTSRPLKSPKIMGGVGRGFCPPTPHLLQLEAVNTNSVPSRSSTQNTAPSDMQNPTQNPAQTPTQNPRQSPTQSDDESRLHQSPIEFIRRIETFDNEAHISDSSLERISEYPLLGHDDHESKVFLFSPWRQKTEILPSRTECDPFCVVDEIQTIRVTLQNPLLVDLVLDEVEVITAGGLVECYPVTILIPSSNRSSPCSSYSVNRMKCDLNILPKEPCHLHLLGIRYSLTLVDSTHLILKDTAQLQSYFANVVKEGVESSKNEDVELDVLKYVTEPNSERVIS